MHQARQQASNRSDLRYKSTNSFSGHVRRSNPSTGGQKPLERGIPGLPEPKVKRLDNKRQEKFCAQEPELGHNSTTTLQFGTIGSRPGSQSSSVSFSSSPVRHAAAKVPSAYELKDEEYQRSYRAVPDMNPFHERTEYGAYPASGGTSQSVFSGPLGSSPAAEGGHKSWNFSSVENESFKEFVWTDAALCSDAEAAWKPLLHVLPDDVLKDVLQLHAERVRSDYGRRRKNKKHLHKTLVDIIIQKRYLVSTERQCIPKEQATARICFALGEELCRSEKWKHFVSWYPGTLGLLPLPRYDLLLDFLDTALELQLFRWLMRRELKRVLHIFNFSYPRLQDRDTEKIQICYEVLPLYPRSKSRADAQLVLKTSMDETQNKSHPESIDEVAYDVELEDADLPVAYKRAIDRWKSGAGRHREWRSVVCMKRIRSKKWKHSVWEGQNLPSAIIRREKFASAKYLWKPKFLIKNRRLLALRTSRGGGKRNRDSVDDLLGLDEGSEYSHGTFKTSHFSPNISEQNMQPLMPDQQRRNQASGTAVNIVVQPERIALPLQNYNGIVLGGLWQIAGFMRSENQGSVYAIVDLCGKGAYAKIYNLRGRSARQRSGLTKDLRRISGGSTVIDTLEWDGYRMVVYNEKHQKNNAEGVKTQKLGAAGIRNSAFFESAFPRLPNVAVDRKYEPQGPWKHTKKAQSAQRKRRALKKRPSFAREANGRLDGI